jgi:hypothetical protein
MGEHRDAHPDPPGEGWAETFDSVRIVRSPETIAAGFADRTGDVYGVTTPSVTRVEVIGLGDEDVALNVAFEDGTSAWFDPSLVVDVQPEDTDRA